MTNEDPKAGTNEKHFREAMAAKFSAKVLAGKKRYVSRHEGFDPVEISVDNSIDLPDGRTVLIEVDSANMAKLLAGQYALLNGLYDGVREKTLFLVVHYYIDYNAHRTLKNLNAIQQFSPGKEWLPYNAIHMSDFATMIKEADSITALIDGIWPKSFLSQGDRPRHSAPLQRTSGSKLVKSLRK